MAKNIIRKNVDISSDAITEHGFAAVEKKIHIKKQLEEVLEAKAKSLKKLRDRRNGKA